MSRSGYCDELDDQWQLIRWRGAVTSALRGKRGQKFLIELRDALDAMPTKELIANELQADGHFCTLGVIGAARGIDMAEINPEDSEHVSRLFGIAEAMAREIVYENDEVGYDKTPAERWQRIRKWVEANITPAADASNPPTQFEGA